MVLRKFTDSGGSCASSSSSVDDDTTDPSYEINPSSNQKPFKKIRNVRKSNIYKCAVCGDKPTGYHYDVLSCNGCKTFFRRTIITKRRFACARDGKCEFTKDFRCACRACRFAKCVSAGMNPKAIQFSGNDDLDQEEEDLSVVSVSKTIRTEETDYMTEMDSIVHKEKALQKLRENDMPSLMYPDAGLDELFPLPSALGKRKQKIRYPPQVECYKKHPVRFWMVADLYLTVEYAKTFPEFQKMKNDDKANFMYNIGGLSQIITQAYYSIAKESDSLVFPDGVDALHWQVVKLHQSDFELYYRECYCRPVDIIRALDMDLPEFVMFKTIALFSIEDELESTAQKRIKKKREELLAIFRKYLIQKYDVHRGTEKLSLCLFTLKTFIEFSEKRRSHMFVADLTKRVQLSRIAAAIFLKKDVEVNFN